MSKRLQDISHQAALLHEKHAFIKAWGQLYMTSFENRDFTQISIINFPILE